MKKVKFTCLKVKSGNKEEVTLYAVLEDKGFFKEGKIYYLDVSEFK